VKGKQWKAPKAPNKNPLVRTTFARRITKAKQVEATKALERQLIEDRKQTETVSLPILSTRTILISRSEKKHRKLGKPQEKNKRDMN
jgi:hypothetical protein